MPATTHQRTVLAASLVASLALACAGTRPVLRAVDYDVDVRLDPAAHRLSGEAEVTLERIDPERPLGRRVVVELRLHPDLAVESVRLDAGKLRSHRERAGEPGPGEVVAPTIHRLVIGRPAATIRATLAYRGRLQQDVAAGEREGEIHNFAVSAHVGEEGVYLDAGGYWYPRLELPAGGDPDLGLSGFELVTDPIAGFELVAGLESVGQENGKGDDGRLRWASPFPLDGMVLLGGPLERASRRHGDVELHAVLAPGKAAVAADILAAAAEMLDRYTPLLGPYPFSEFTVLEAFFSSGFAFPTATQIAGSQLSEYRQYRRHGYLDHELLHNWWGNGVFVDPRDGNWCEGLASYLGNYYGFVLDGDEEGARKQRRNHSNFLSSIEPADDKPLGTFQLAGGAASGIGYNKGAAVFHMLERKIGPAAMSAGLRRLAAERMGRHASWRELEEAFEGAGGEDLGAFFDQWVRRGGAPLLELREARWRPGDSLVQVTLSQGPTSFVLDVPLRLYYGEESEDVTVTIAETVEAVEVPCRREGLTAIELDPDYHLFRKLAPEEVMPTSALTRHAAALTAVVPDGELAAGYRTVLDAYTRAVLGDEDDPHEDHELTVVAASGLDPSMLDETSVLILGDAILDPKVAAFVGRTRSPVTWGGDGFAVEGGRYAGPGQAVFLTVHHPSRAGDGVTVYYGNSEAALANARVLGYYPNSLLVFESPLDAPAAESEAGMPRSEVIRRLDFELHERIELEPEEKAAKEG
ncbi:MAG: M1 family aminopeptidase [Acidobacteriota bacterium]|nr:M1 family aminopeptidase [Acidobacteriota bacterium]